ncbi:MAG: hypothetical protein WAN42_04620, partial [Pseudolabrys sp.]
YIVEHGQTVAVWKRLLQKVNLLSSQFQGATDYAGNIAAVLRQARYIAAFDRIEISGKHDNRNMAASAYDCLQGDLGASDNQQVGLSTQQFSRADEWAARIVDGAIFNDNVLSFAKTVLFQLRRKRSMVLRHRRYGEGRRPEKSYSGDFFSLLCAGAKRPR